MMELRRAAENTLTMVSKNCSGRSQSEKQVREIMEKAERREDGRGAIHAVWLLRQVASGDVSGEKGHRWLGYAQGVLCENGYVTLADCKYANVLS